MKGQSTMMLSTRVIARGDIELSKADTKDNFTDMLTKTLSTAKFKHCLDLVGDATKNRTC